MEGCYSADHIIAIQWAFNSLDRAVDTSSLPLVAKGRRDFNLGCVSSIVMFKRKRRSEPMARRARARPAARPRSPAGGMPKSTRSRPTGVGRKQPATIRRLQPRLISSRSACPPPFHTGAQHPAGAHTSARAEVKGADGPAPPRTHKPTDRTSAPRTMTPSPSPARRRRQESAPSSLTPRQAAAGRKPRRPASMHTSS